MMRKFLIFILTLQSLTVLGQYIPNNSQAYQFASMYNPAFTGIESFDDAKLSYRYQWAGFGEYAPKFVNLTYNARLRQPLDLSYNSLRLSNASLTKPERLPRGKRIIHGFGANVFYTKVGIVKLTGIGFNYGFHYPLTNKVKLAAGVATLIENINVSIEDITVRDPDPYYDYLRNNSTAQTDLNVRAGILLYSNNFYLGFSYLPLLNLPIQKSGIALQKAFYRGSLQTGISFAINPDIMLKPSIFALLQMNNKLSIDYGVKAYIQNKGWFGVTYRDIQTGVGILGFNINESISAAYSYELSLGEFRDFNDGSHELVLSVRMRNHKKLNQYTW